MATQGGGDAFGRGVARIAVAQICEGAGFQSSQHSALDALADIAVRYLADLGKAAQYYANIAGRTECNVFDVIQALEDLNASQGFAGASDVNRTLSSSGAVRDIIQYAGRSEEIPFARPVPRFPLVRKRDTAPTFVQLGETPPHSHIPAWLPAFPDPHTYKHTPVWSDRKTDPRIDKIEQARQRRKAERSLVHLQQRLALSGTVAMEPEAADVGGLNKAKGKRPAENPFLVPPLGPREKQISPIRSPGGFCSDGPKQIPSKATTLPSVLEAFAPALEASKNGLDVVEDAEGPSRNRRAQALPDERPLVHFKFDFGKKAMAAAPVASGPNSELPLSYWFGREEEKDDRKKRAEQVLKEAMENTQELTQL